MSTIVRRLPADVDAYELYHHGIKGQKWGVRRYQNEDGSLTEAGKRKLDKYKQSQLQANDKYYEKAINRATKIKDSSKKRLIDSHNRLDKEVNSYNRESKVKKLQKKTEKTSQAYIRDMKNWMDTMDQKVKTNEYINNMTLDQVADEKVEVGKAVALSVSETLVVNAVFRATGIPITYVPLPASGQAIKNNYRINQIYGPEYKDKKKG